MATTPQKTTGANGDLSAQKTPVAYPAASNISAAGNATKVVSPAPTAKDGGNPKDAKAGPAER